MVNIHTISVQFFFHGIIFKICFLFGCTLQMFGKFSLLQFIFDLYIKQFLFVNKNFENLIEVLHRYSYCYQKISKILSQFYKYLQFLQNVYFNQESALIFSLMTITCHYFVILKSINCRDLNTFVHYVYYINLTQINLKKYLDTFN